MNVLENSNLMKMSNKEIKTLAQALAEKFNLKEYSWNSDIDGCTIQSQVSKLSKHLWVDIARVDSASADKMNYLVLRMNIVANNQ